MTIAYPRKLNNSMTVRDIFKQFVLSDREIHLTSTAIAKINNIAAKTIPILLKSSMMNIKNLKKAP